MKLQPADIRIKWDWMRPKIEEMFKGTRDRPEELYAACRYGHACLYVSDDCFAVIEPTLDRNTGETVAFVWAIWGSSGNTMSRYMPELERIAREGGAVRLAGNTVHDEIANHFSRLGYVKAMTAFERSI